MGIVNEFDPTRDGWSFANWPEASDFSWELYRRTYLAINPTNDPTASPLDVAFFQIFKGCAANGNCGGMSMLALALFKYGGYMGFCSPPSFYAPANTSDHKQPARADLHEAVNIMQARQFSAAGIRNFLDVVKAGQLNDGVATWNRVRSGLGSGDYCMLSLSNGVFGDAAHTIIPYRADMSGSAYVLHVWDPNRPYAWFPQHCDGDHNKIVITGPTSWIYDQTADGFFKDGTIYDGSKNGWCFAVPTSLEIHKGRQPISAGFVVTGLVTLFVSGVGSAVTQIEDDKGRRLYTSDRLHRSRGDLETSAERRLPGVAPWPWPGGLAGDLPGELFSHRRPRRAEREGPGAPRGLARRRPVRGGEHQRAAPPLRRPPPARRHAGRLAKRQGSERSRHHRPAAGARARRVRRRRDLGDNGTAPRRHRAPPLRRPHSRRAQPGAAARARGRNPAHSPRLGAPRSVEDRAGAVQDGPRRQYAEERPRLGLNCRCLRPARDRRTRFRCPFPRWMRRGIRRVITEA
jgi:hypothetical protein